MGISFKVNYKSYGLFLSNEILTAFSFCNHPRNRYEHAIDFGGQPSQMIDPDGGLEQKDHYNAKFGSKIPEPPTLLSPPAGHAGPNGSLAIGWPLEKLLLRMAGVVKGFTYGRAQIPNTTNSEYVHFYYFTCC